MHSTDVGPELAYGATLLLCGCNAMMLLCATTVPLYAAKLCCYCMLLLYAATVCSSPIAIAMRYPPTVGCSSASVGCYAG
eukprot:3572007-Rhodomonas_salina.2